MRFLLRTIVRAIIVRLVYVVMNRLLRRGRFR
jgi:hypothetical protein